jgi:hypothetical protein
MPKSNEAGSRSPELTSALSGTDNMTLIQTLDQIQEQGLQARYVLQNGMIEETRQLPSPSLTPSPSVRSRSNSFAATDASSAEWNGVLSSIPRNYSESFESSPNHNLLEIGKAAIPPPISKVLTPHSLHDIPEEKARKPRKLSSTKSNGEDRILRLTAAEIGELTSAPESLPITSPRLSSFSGQSSLGPSPIVERKYSFLDVSRYGSEDRLNEKGSKSNTVEPLLVPDVRSECQLGAEFQGSMSQRRPGFSSRAISTPPVINTRMSSYTKATPGQSSPKRKPTPSHVRPENLDLNTSARSSSTNRGHAFDPPSPIPQSIPLPPMSMPTYLQLELSSGRPSPLYIYRSAMNDVPYESSKIKFQRLLNFLLLPPQLEQVLYFGSLACLDSLLHTFTILPLRFFKAIGTLMKWWVEILAKEARFIAEIIYHGAGRMWLRQRGRQKRNDSSSRSRSVSRASRPPVSTTTTSHQNQNGRLPETPENGNINANMDLKAESERKSRPSEWGHKHRRKVSHPSSLSSNHKADLLQGAVIICSCLILMRLDASRMYHSIKGQAAIKLYVIYNVLEVSPPKLFENIC